MWTHYLWTQQEANSKAWKTFGSLLEEMAIEKIKDVKDEDKAAETGAVIFSLILSTQRPPLKLLALYNESLNFT